MLFNSFEYLCFLPVVLIIYFCIPRKGRYLWLLAASYFFYMCWNAAYALLLLFSTAVTYFCSLAMERISRSENPRKSRHQKWIMIAGLVVNFGILFFYKYFNFTMVLVQGVMDIFRIQLHVPRFDIILPVGISFFTFQAVGYMIDVYRGDVEVETNFFRYALFVSFFPQLVAGPIERSKNLLHQLKDTDKYKFNFDYAVEGLLMILWGFFLKIVIADRAAIYVDNVFADVSAANGVSLIVAVFLFAIQIYCDFYGYSSIAVGSAKILGIQLMENFKAPYLSASVSEFWRNWHISLTSWFKDYLYIPLGGSRKGTIRKYLNKMIVFLCSGLWHGASLTFVVWGGINGLYQIIEEIFTPVRKFLERQRIIKSIYRVIAVIFTFVLIGFSWIFFRASTLTDAFAVIKTILYNTQLSTLLNGSILNYGLDQAHFYLMLFCIGLLFLADGWKRLGFSMQKWLKDKWICWIVIAVSIFFILLFGVWGPAYSEASFIYFQF